MERGLHRHLLLLIFFLVAGAEARAGRRTQPDFITAVCSSTVYPDVCAGRLSRYADAIRHKSVRRLAHAALKETLSQAKTASAAVYLLSSGGGAARPTGSREEAGALADCAQCLGDSVQLLWRSVWQMEHIGRRGTARYGYQLRCVLTWLSGALTNQNTCLDGLIPRSGVRTNVNDDVKGKVDGVARMNSVALALVNMIDGGQQ